ncbi:transcription factor TFIIF complex subunit Tfg3 [Coemansia sp. Benny D160-2]|nr:transcription factor TFIIF complex subunit Tfg3 [Coemansia sp. Benny D160-2]
MDTEVVLGIHTQQHDTGRTAVSGGIEYSLRRWSCTLHEGRSQVAGTTQLPYIQKVEFILHETFDTPHRVVTRAPFRVEEEGWGEFDLIVIVHMANSPDTYKIVHDLNFQEGESYTKRYPFVIPNPTPGFLALFYKPTSFSRKTIPKRATKARKGPPRDSAYANSTSRLSSDSESFSDSDASDATSELEEDSETASRPHQRYKAEDETHVAMATQKHEARDPPSIRMPKTRPTAPGGLTKPEKPGSGSLRHIPSPPDAARALSRGTSSSSTSVAAVSRQGMKRRLSDVHENSTVAATAGGITNAKRHTADRGRTSGEPRTLSYSPPQQKPQQHDSIPETTNAEQPKRTMASAIASMRVPKKQAFVPKSSGTAATTTTAAAAVAATLHANAESPQPSATSNREAFIRERERQRYIDTTAESPSARAVKRVSPTSEAAVRKKPSKRESDNTHAPKRSQDDAGSKKMQQPRPSKASDDLPKRSLAEADGGSSDTLRLSPHMVKRMERIMERASLLNERQLVAFLRLLHALRIQQDPESAQTMTAQAVDLVRSSGEYSCNLSVLSSTAIDRLWAFVKEAHA